VPLYDFTRLSDGEPVAKVMGFDEVCGSGGVMEIDGQFCRRLPPYQTEARVDRDRYFKAWSLPTAGGTDRVTGYTMPKRGEEGAPHYDKDGVAVFNGRQEIRDFCRNAARATKGRSEYRYGD
jgi:hypothetical protein